MKIGLIGPGIMPIPPPGWGAVEILIWDYYNLLKKKNNVIIINEIRNNPGDQSPGTEYSNRLIEKINSYNFDFVHIHYDVLYYIIPNLNCKKIGLTSHYPYIDNEEYRRRDGFEKIFRFMVDNKNIINFVLADKDIDVLRKNNASNIVKLENGIDKNLFKFVKNPEKPNRTIYLGKIDDRKNQNKYQEIKCIDFVGPISCQKFKSKHYLGTWSRDEVQNKLTEYANLVLLSKGEADPLVVKEALMSGLGVVINKTSSKNLPNKSFIMIIEDEKMNDISFITQKIEENRVESLKRREEIRKFAEDHFSWEKLIKKYIRSI